MTIYCCYTFRFPQAYIVVENLTNFKHLRHRQQVSGPQRTCAATNKPLRFSPTKVRSIVAFSFTNVLYISALFNGIFPCLVLSSCWVSFVVRLTYTRKFFQHVLVCPPHTPFRPFLQSFASFKCEYIGFTTKRIQLLSASSYIPRRSLSYNRSIKYMT